MRGLLSPLMSPKFIFFFLTLGQGRGQQRGSGSEERSPLWDDDGCGSQGGGGDACKDPGHVVGAGSGHKGPVSR